MTTCWGRNFSLDDFFNDITCRDHPVEGERVWAWWLQAKKMAQDSGASSKGRGVPMSEVPCTWFRSDAGWRAGKRCKWNHSWEGIGQKNARCWNCRSKEHRKTDCKVKGGGQKRLDETKVSGGGTASSSSAPATTTSKTSLTLTPIKPKVNELSNATAPTTTSRGSWSLATLEVKMMTPRRALEMKEREVNKRQKMKRQLNFYMKRRSC